MIRVVTILKNNLFYVVAFLIVVGMLSYSFFLYTGAQEAHLYHLKSAAIYFPFIANSSFQNTLLKDFLLGSLLVMVIVLAGYFYWLYQDRVSRFNFSFENEYYWESILGLFLFAFAISQVIKQLVMKIRSR